MDHFNAGMEGQRVKVVINNPRTGLRSDFCRRGRWKWSAGQGSRGEGGEGGERPKGFEGT